jgi:Sec7-like guanine-nucleotide exchange factor
VAIQEFNNMPTKGIDHLVSLGIITPTPQAVAKFLHSSHALSKRKLGEYLGEGYVVRVKRSVSAAVIRCSVRVCIGNGESTNYLYYLCNRDDFPKLVLEAFIDEFDFTNFALDTALRLVFNDATTVTVNNSINDNVN